MIARERLNELAIQAFQHWLDDLTNGEVDDMLRGNSASYTGMPNLSRWLDQHELNEVCEYSESER